MIPDWPLSLAKPDLMLFIFLYYYLFIYLLSGMIFCLAFTVSEIIQHLKLPRESLVDSLTEVLRVNHTGWRL